MPVKTKVVDTSVTTPAAFLASSGDPVEIPPSTPQPSPETPVAAPVVTDPDPNQPMPPEDAAKTPAAPVAVDPPQSADPFVLIQKWEAQTIALPQPDGKVINVSPTKRTLRGMNVNGGVVLRLSTMHMGVISDAICFVPDSFVNKEGKLMPPPAI